MSQRPNDKSLPTLAVELKDLVVAYAKQETVEPLKQLGRFVGFGVAGSFVLAVGVVLLVLGLLRGLQEVSTFDGTWSFVPYLITLVACAIVVGLSARAIGAAKRRRSAR
ncbi:MAG TPA: phage holin family protein [Acidimicrobiales bacterium]|nr:phage holin family protein [Acidimicrobiales bacterium]